MSPVTPTGEHMRLVWPQWQGAGTESIRRYADEFPFEIARRGYVFGARVLQAVLPDHDGPTEFVPVEMGHAGLGVRDGIEAKNVVLDQLRAALRLIADHRPSRITTLGGECSVSMAPFAALIDRYGDDLAILVITHDLLSAGYLADRVVVLFGGHVVEEGAASTVLANPVHPYSRLLAAASPGLQTAPPSVRVDRYPPTSTTATAGVVDGEACPFLARCPFAVDRCRNEYPRLLPGPTGASVRCHRSAELDTVLAEQGNAEVNQERES